MNETKLTLKQKKFCEHYLKTGNATQAALKAGYSKKTAGVIGQENLKKPYIIEYLRTRGEKSENKRIADANEVLEFLTRVLRGEEAEQFGLEVSVQDKLKAAEQLAKRYRIAEDGELLELKKKQLDLENRKKEIELKQLEENTTTDTNITINITGAKNED